MRVLPIHPDIVAYLAARNLEKKFRKQVRFLEQNVRHPSLAVEALEPKRLRIFSFRIDEKYRAIFIFRDYETVEVIDVNNHYR